MSSTRTASADKAKMSFLRANATTLSNLPSPGTTYRWKTVTGVTADIQRLLDYNVIIKVGEIETDDSDIPINQYRTDRDTYQLIKDLASDTPTLPCGHVGFVTVSTEGDGEYKCSECKKRFARPTIKDAYSGGGA